MIKIRMKPGMKHHRREDKLRVVKYFEDGPFEVDEHEYNSIRDKVDRLDLPHMPKESEPETKSQTKVEAKTQIESDKEDTENKEVKEDKEEQKDSSKDEQEKEAKLELKFAGNGEWNVLNTLTGKNINDVPLNIDEAKALL